MTLRASAPNVGGILAQNVALGGRNGRVADSFAATPIVVMGTSGAITETLAAEVSGIYFDSSVMGLVRACGGSCVRDASGGMGIDGRMRPDYFRLRTNFPCPRGTSTRFGKRRLTPTRAFADFRRFERLS